MPAAAREPRPVVLVQSAPVFGATEGYLLAVAEGLRDGGVEAAVLYPDVPELQPFARVGGSVRALPFPPAALHRPALATTLRLVRAFRKLRPRIVHVNDPWPAAQVAARLALVPRTLVTHHTPELPRRDNLHGRLWQWLGWASRPEVVYTSESDRATDGRREFVTHVVYYGIDLDRFVQARPALPKDGPIVGNVARLVPQKGQDVLLEAAARVVERVPEAGFVLVGEGESRADLERLARELDLGDRVQFLGARDDVPGLLASFDVFALPSRFEGLCYAVIEAQAARVPVVATPVGGVRENVVDGETGLIVPVDDVPALADAIVRLLQDSAGAGRLADAAQRRVLARYAGDRMVAETLALYA